MLAFLFGIVIVLITILILIGWHEFGHFCFAKLLGIKTLCFSIGFGRPLWTFKASDGTEYIIAMFPLGGYLKMLDEREAPVPIEQLPYAFNRQPIWKRCLVITAGPVFNLLFAYFAYWLVFVVGITQPIPLIDKIEPQTPAATAGILPGGEIVQIDNHPIATWSGVIIALIPHLGETGTINISIKYQQEIKAYAMQINQWNLNKLRPNPLASLGITPWRPIAEQPWPATLLHTRQYSMAKSLLAAGQEIWLYTHFNAVVIKKLITGALSIQSLSGPVGIFAGTIAAAKHGFSVYMAFIGFISLALALTNLLPIPGLDGSHLVYLFIEKLRRGKPVSLAVQLLLFRLGIILILILLTQTMINDLLRLA